MVKDSEKNCLKCSYIASGLYPDVYLIRPEWTHLHRFRHRRIKTKKSPKNQPQPRNLAELHQVSSNGRSQPGQWSTPMHPSGTRQSFRSGNCPGTGHRSQLRNPAELHQVNTHAPIRNPSKFRSGNRPGTGHRSQLRNPGRASPDQHIYTHPEPGKASDQKPPWNRPPATASELFLNLT